MAPPQSISVKQISAAAKGSAAKALDQHKLKIPHPYVLGFLPPWWWCGIIWRNPIDQVTLGDANRLAADVHQSIAASVPGAKGGTPGVLTAGGFTTVGFAPPPGVNVIEE